MAENSAISWTDHTFNPWWGCTKVGPGCDGCYAEAFDKRVGGAHWGAGAPRREIKDWSKPRKWNREAERTGVRPWVFCASMADVFDNEVPSEWRDRLWALVRETRFLNWIFVTKRIGNAAKMLPQDWPEAFAHCGLCSTIVNQAEADRDIPKLLATPAAWRGVSMEPLLGPVDISRFMWPVHGWWFGPYRSYAEAKAAGAECGRKRQALVWAGCVFLDWVIVGGESGPGARPMHPDWARSLRDQCELAKVSFHFKQHGAFRPIAAIHDVDDSSVKAIIEAEEDRSLILCIDGREWPNQDGQPPDDAWMMERVGKTRAGRLLDGREHNGMPEVRHG